MISHPKYLLFIINPIDRTVLLVHHHSAAAGSNQWNGVLCPSTSEGGDLEPEGMILFEIFTLTQNVYSSMAWLNVGHVTYDEGRWGCDILVSLTTDFSFADHSGDLRSRVKVVPFDHIARLEKNKVLAPGAHKILTHVCNVLDDLSPSTEEVESVR